jgi:hypothetical protein
LAVRPASVQLGAVRQAGGRFDASIAKTNIKWEGRETKKLNGTLLSDELGFWYSIQ